MPVTSPTILELLKKFQTLYKERKFHEIVRIYDQIAHIIRKKAGASEIKRTYEAAQDQLAQLTVQQQIDEMRKEPGERNLGALQSSDEVVRDFINDIKTKEYDPILRHGPTLLKLDPENWRVEQLLRHATKKAEINQKKKRILVDDYQEERVSKKSEGQTDRMPASKIIPFHEIHKVQKEDSAFQKWQTSMGQHLRHGYEYARSYGLRVVGTIKARMQESSYDKLKRRAMKLIREKREDNLLAAKLQKSATAHIDQYTLPGFEVWGDTFESQALGGDIFNFIQRDEDNILLYAGDAAGHGIEAALLASQVNYYLHHAIETQANFRDVIITVNDNIRTAKQPGNGFMTMVFFNWNLKTKTLSYIGCGHEYFLIYRRNTNKVEQIQTGGIAIGMVDDIGHLIEEKEIALSNGDELIIYSDGVIDSVIKKNIYTETKPDALFGLKALESIIEKMSHTLDIHEQFEKVIQEIGAKTYQNDDVTLIMLRRNESLDIEYGTDSFHMDSVDLPTLEKLARTRVDQAPGSDKNDKVKLFILELENLMARGEFQLVILKATRAIEKQSMFHPRINALLKEARKALEEERIHRKKSLISSAISVAKEELSNGEYLKAKMALMKVMKLEEHNRSITFLLHRIESMIALEGNRNPKKKQKKDFNILRDLHDWVTSLIQPVSQKDVFGFFVRLANLIGAGIQLKDALMILLRQSKKTGQKRMLATMIINLEKGLLLSYSMAGYRFVFSSLQVNLVKAGEESGNLGLILDEISTEMQESTEIRKKIKGALIYPVFILLFSIALMIGMLIGVVPRLAAAYADSGLQLPLATRVMIAISHFIAYSWYWLALLIALIFIGIKIYYRTIPGRLLFDKIMLKVPVIRDMIRSRNIYLFGNSLSLLMESGILLLSSLSITADVVDNIYFKREVTRIRNEITNGRAFSIALGISSLDSASRKENEYFPLEVAQMVQVGEATGQMTKMLKNVAVSNQKKLNQFARDFSTLVEPIMIVLVGVMVGSLILSIMLPFFQFGKVIQNS